MTSSEPSYTVDWASLDELFERIGGLPDLVPDPAHKWRGAAVELLMLGGVAQCPVCEDVRREGQLCPYCLRWGGQEDFPERFPPAPPRSDIKFRPAGAPAPEEEEAAARDPEGEPDPQAA